MFINAGFFFSSLARSSCWPLSVFSDAHGPSPRLRALMICFLLCCGSGRRVLRSRQFVSMPMTRASKVSPQSEKKADPKRMAGPEQT